MTASPPRAMIAPWHRRVSLAPSAVTMPITSPKGICASRSASNGLSFWRLEVSLTAHIPVPASMAIWTFLLCLQSDGPCFRACHLRSSRNLVPVLSINRFSGCPEARYGPAPRSAHAGGIAPNSPEPASQAQPSGSGSLPAQPSAGAAGRKALLPSSRTGWLRPSTFRAIRAYRIFSHDKLSRDRTRMTSSRACTALNCSWTSSLYGSGSGKASACLRANCQVPLSEPFPPICETRSARSAHSSCPSV